jgi:outer membrane lipoprotein LolB
MSSCKLLLLLVVAAFLAACAAPAKPIHTQDTPVWSGRIAIKVDSDPVQHISAGFTLQGSESAGTLSLFTPLGAKAAEVIWQSQPMQQARVTSDKGIQIYDSADAALAQLTGAELPVAELFTWLKGSATSGVASQAKSGWQVDLSRHTNGRITAVKELPASRIEIRVVLEL